jgi:hypothetical protein
MSIGGSVSVSWLRPSNGGSRTMIVQRCDCGIERQRLLLSELLQGREVPVE